MIIFFRLTVQIISDSGLRRSLLSFFGSLARPSTCSCDLGERRGCGADRPVEVDVEPAAVVAAVPDAGLLGVLGTRHSRLVDYLRDFTICDGCCVVSQKMNVRVDYAHVLVAIILSYNMVIKVELVKF